MRGRFSRGAKFARAYGSLSVGLMLAALLTSCGSSSNGPAATTAASSGAAGHAGLGAGSAPGGRSKALRASKPAKLPSGTVAKVDGIPITLAAYTHQLQISAQGPVKPLISGASDYPACMAALKSREERNRKLAHAEEEKYAKRFKGRKSPGFVRGRKPVGSTERKRQCEQLYKSAKEQAVSNLIRRIWAQTQAKELGVSISESEVAKRVKAREASQKAFAKNARSREFLAEVPHYTGNDLREMITDGLLEEKISAKVREKFVKAGSVSQEKLEKYFNEHKQLYGAPERRSIVYATSKSKSTAEVLAREHLSGGLKAAASKHSIIATPTLVGCQHSGAVKNGGSTALTEAICSAKTGVVSSVLSAASGYYVFEVKSITPSSQPSFAQEKEQIKRMLGSQGQVQGVVKYNEEIRIKQREKTECAAGYLTPLCK
jgi:hypothetical protein